MTIQGVVKLMSDAIKTDKQNTGKLSHSTLQKCANGVKWMLSLNSIEHQVMAVKDFVANDRDVVAQMFLNAEFNKMCPELIAFAKQNNNIFRK